MCYTYIYIDMLSVVPTFLAPETGFMEDNFSIKLEWGQCGFGMIQVLYIHCAFYFYYYYISSTSDHQALGPGSWGPLCFFIYVDMILINPRWIQFAGGVRFLY